MVRGPHTRYKNGACHKAGHCDIDRESCRGCPVCEGGWSECEHFICTEAEDTVEGCSVTEAKRLLRKFGGSAWTNHCERAGSVFEVTDITLKAIIAASSITGICKHTPDLPG